MKGRKENFNRLIILFLNFKNIKGKHVVSYIYLTKKTQNENL